MRTTHRRFWRPSMWLALIVFAASSTAPASAASPAGSDITTSRAGHRAAIDAAARFTKSGVATRASDLMVLDFGSRGSMIAPRGSTVAGPGKIITSPGPSRRTMGPRATQAWNLVDSMCFARIIHGGEHWIDTCYHLKKLTNDGNGNTDYFGLHTFGTAYSPRLEAAWIETSRCCGPAQTWFDWDLRADKQLNCEAFSLGITVLGVGMSAGTTICEWWRITKWAEAGHFKTRWTIKSGDWWCGECHREVASMIGVKVPQGTWPQWFISSDVDWW